jgi:hypothetical protein
MAKRVSTRKIKKTASMVMAKRAQRWGSMLIRYVLGGPVVWW